MHMLQFSTTLWSHTLLLFHPTHLCPVLWVHLHFLNQIACHLTATHLGCPMQHGVAIAVSFMELCCKRLRKELDHFQMSTCCSLVHGIVSILPRDHTKGKSIKMAANTHNFTFYTVLMQCRYGKHGKKLFKP